MKYEFLWFSMRGMNWIPCVVVSMNPCGEYYIRYFDDILQGLIEATVDPDFVRIKKSEGIEATDE